MVKPFEVPIANTIRICVAVVALASTLFWIMFADYSAVGRAAQLIPIVVWSVILWPNVKIIFLGTTVKILIISIGLSFFFYDMFVLIKQFDNILYPTIFHKISELRIQNKETFPAANANQNNKIDGTYLVNGRSILPLGTIPNVTIVQCRESNGFITIKSDRYGFNNDDTIWRSNSGTDVVFVGDSFTQGVCVPRNQSFVGLVQREFPKTLNLGISGNGPLRLLATVREFAAVAQPGNLIWVHYENDLSELKTEMENEHLRKYLRTGYRQNLARITASLSAVAKPIVNENLARKFLTLDMSQPWTRLFRAVTRMFTFNNSFTLLRNRILFKEKIKIHGKFSGVDKELFKIFKNILELARDEVLSYKSRLLFVYLPAITDCRPPTKRSTRKQVLEIARSLDLPTFDLTPRICRRRNPEGLYTGHFTLEGNAIVADELLAIIRQQARIGEPS